MKTWCILFIMSCGLCARVFAQAELRGTETELTEFLPNVPRTMFVAGQAEVKVQADRAVVRLKVATTGKGLEQALQANQQARNKLLDFLRERGIPNGQVQSSKFSSTPKYGMFSREVTFQAQVRVEYLAERQ